LGFAEAVEWPTVPGRSKHWSSGRIQLGDGLLQPGTFHHGLRGD
jgi:hypothetical protein